MASKTCAICGKPSGMYPLCKDCFKLRDEGKIEQCPNCKKWHFIDKPCKCNKPKLEKCEICGKMAILAKNKDGKKICANCLINSNKKDNKKDETISSPQESAIDTITINQENKSKCITCGRKTDGLLFCSECYKKYKEKTLYFCIRNCSKIELVEEGFEGIYVCKDGHVVKSKSERDIDNYLFENGIFHAYEKEIRCDDGTKLHPDFYLPNYLGEKKHVYLEHWGYNENNIQYQETKKFKIARYKELKITLINTYEKDDARDIESTLDYKLEKSRIKEGSINYEEK